MSRPTLFAMRYLAVALASWSAAHAGTLPVAPVVVNGTATFVQGADRLTVTNSNGAIINWQSFSIGKDDTVRFNQASAASSVLNRVTGSDPSLLLGSLQSNGRVFLVNPAGILVGAGARIDVGGFVASTLQISDADFIARRFRFTDTPGAGNVRNEGTIVSPSGGSVYLLAPEVENSGVIRTPNGETILAAGKSIQLIDSGAPGVRVEITGGRGDVSNLGSIVADAGRVGMVGALVRNSGTLSASSAVNEGGRVFLRGRNVTQTDTGRITVNGSQGGQVSIESRDTSRIEGRISAVGTSGDGGDVRILGDKVGLFNDTYVNASGSADGGRILIGGDFQGKNASVRNAEFAWVGADAKIAANGGERGDGGRVIVWADGTTRFYGHIAARGGSKSGDGGFAEVSGKQFLNYFGMTDLRAPKGLAGTLLLDPAAIFTIAQSGTGLGSTPDGNGNEVFTSGSSSTIYWNTIESQLAGSNVIIHVNGQIDIVGSPGAKTAFTIAHAGGGARSYANYYDSINDISLLATENINVQASFGNKGNGSIIMAAGWDGVASGGYRTNPVVNAAYNINIGGVNNEVIVFNRLGNVRMEAGSTLNIQAGSPSIGPNANAAAGIDMGSGNLQVNALNVEVRGAAISGYTSTNSPGFIATSGNQIFNIGAGGHVWVWGGGSGGTDYNNWAQIKAYGDGDQTFNIGTGGSISVLSGGGTGAAPAAGSSCPPSGANRCSNNYAAIQTYGRGDQRIDFAGTGTLTVSAGSGAVAGRGNNYAEVGASKPEAQSVASGRQIITGAADIEVISEGAGGFSYNGKDFSNSASLYSENAQQITAASMSIDASASTGMASAFVGAPRQTIILSGALELKGGSSNAGTMMWPGAIAALGNDLSADITLVAGDLTMDSGSGARGGAWMGSLSGAAEIDLTVTSGGIDVSGSVNAKAGFGSFNETKASRVSLVNAGSSSTFFNADSIVQAGAGGEIRLVSDQDIVLYGGSLLAAAGGTLTLTSAGTISQDQAAGTLASSLIAGAADDISLLGRNRAQSFVGVAASGAVAYVSDAATVTVSAVAEDSITLQTTGLPSSYYSAATPRNISLGLLKADSVRVEARNAILDANGNALNIDTPLVNGSVDLKSHYGVNTGIAISADLKGDEITAEVTGQASMGGISVRTQGTKAPYVLNLIDGSGKGSIMYAHGGSGNVDLYESDIYAANGSVVMAVAAGSMKLANSSAVHASGDIGFVLPASDASFSLDGGSQVVAGYSSGSTGTIQVNMLGRTAGGIFIDGIETAVTPPGAGSGFYTSCNCTPAVLGSGLKVIYGINDVSAVVTTDVVKEIVKLNTNPDSSTSTSNGVSDSDDDSSQSGEGSNGKKSSKNRHMCT